MKKLKLKKANQKPVQGSGKQDDRKYVSDMGIGFRVVDMHADLLSNN
jgi:hypothetical protein